MKLIGSFFRFAERVLNATKQAKLSGNDQKKLERLLTRTGKRNLILAKGLLSALNVGGAKQDDIDTLANLLEKASQRMNQDKDPFMPNEKKQLEDVFVRSYISRKAAHWFAGQMDELLAEEIDEFISGRRMMTIPAKKGATIEVEDKRKEKTAR